jgi:hypothetical protein
MQDTSIKSQAQDQYARLSVLGVYNQTCIVTIPLTGIWQLMLAKLDAAQATPIVHFT